MEEHRKLVEKILKRDQKRRKRIEDAGIEYECPEIVSSKCLLFSLVRVVWPIAFICVVTVKINIKEKHAKSLSGKYEIRVLMLICIKVVL